MKTLPTLRIAQFALCGWLLSGCYTTTLSSGKPAAPASVEYDEKWHHGVLWGMAELSGPYDLEKVCPSGWSEIKTETSFVNGFVEAVTSGVYSPQTVTVRCAAGAPPPPMKPTVAATVPRPNPSALAAPAVPSAAPAPASSAPEPLPPPPNVPPAP